MKFNTIPYSQSHVDRNHRIEERVNTAVRTFDAVMGRLGLGGRKGYYNDDAYEFEGGARDELRKKHYDKSLRLLWKGEEHASWSSFDDCTREEQLLLSMAEKGLTRGEKAQRKRINSDDYKAFLNKTYTPEQKQAIVNVLSMIGHGEAYAWMVSCELLNEVRSTGGRAALTMQVLEEAKHFVVLRELIQAFEMPIPRLNAFEYVLLERTYKSKGLEKFFGMNVVVEGFALSIFGMMSTLPGLEILKLFHRDESRHTGLPHNYFAEFPMTAWERRNPLRAARRLSLVLPAIPVFFHIEKDLALLGIDTFEFGGALARKVLKLADRVGFDVLVPTDPLAKLVNRAFNEYCKETRPGFTERNFMEAETTLGKEEQQVEKEVFHLDEAKPAKRARVAAVA
jgi:hypothetical protein